MPLPQVHPSLKVLAVLLVCTGALYFQGLNGPFIFDDGPAISSNSYLQIDGSEFDDWRTATLSSDSGPTHRPIAMWSFTANIVASGGVDAFGMKLTNLLIHLACGGLVYLFARIALRRGMRGGTASSVESLALLAAAFWLLAPLHVSTVLYTVQRMAQLATLFSLLGLLLYSYQREKWRRRGATIGEVIALSLWLLLCLLLATFSKENGLLLLWLLPVVEVTLFRGEWAGRDNTGLRWLGWAALVAPLLMLGCIALYSPATLVGGYVSREFSLEERLLTQLRLLWQYLAWMVWPDINAMGFQHDDLRLSRGWLDPVTTLVSAVAWLAFTIGAFLARRVYPLALFALLFYLVGHSMESSIWPLEMVYEHRNYLPSVGIYILLAAVLASICSLVRAMRPRLVAAVLLSICCTFLFLRVFSWSEQLRLSAVNNANHPDSARSHFFLAESLLHAYRRGVRSGAPEEELGEYLLLARNQFELMHQSNPRDMAAIVMMYYLDQHHFHELQEYNDWFAVLLEVAQDRALQASDYTSLRALMDCFEAGVCREPRERVFLLLDGLLERYPGSPRLSVIRYRYLKSIGAPEQQRLAALQDLQSADNRSSEVFQSLLVELAENGNVAGLYEKIREWMLWDPDRRRLSLIRRMFDRPPVPAGSGTAAQSGASAAPHSPALGPEA